MREHEYTHLFLCCTVLTTRHFECRHNFVSSSVPFFDLERVTPFLQPIFYRVALKKVINEGQDVLSGIMADENIQISGHYMSWGEGWGSTVQ